MWTKNKDSVKVKEKEKNMFIIETHNLKILMTPQTHTQR